MRPTVRRLAIPLLSALVAAAASSCSSSAGTGPGGPELAARLGARVELAAARSRWAAKAPARYRYVFSRSCECLTEATQAARIEVERSVGNPEVITSLTYASGGSAVENRYRALFPSVDGLFDLVQDALDRRAAGLVVSYDPQLGYPRSISIDYDAVMVDDEVVLHASDLEVVP
ncbi:MAG TPA: DUF6174 domain-containing protein [Gemmatimonadaceae bacterium]|nr:DUF6174 domain-containing protein [Gemmatimonadaceae bacterium]